MSWPSFTYLLDAYRRCRLGKRPSVHQIDFERRLGANLLALHREIHSGRYRPSRAACFIVTHPRPREIFAAHFRDRVIHHLIVREIEPLWERHFIHASFACRKEKGPFQALTYLDRQARKVSQGGVREVFALQLDIASFFATIHRPTLTALLRDRLPLGLSSRRILSRLIDVIYSHDPRTNVWIQSSKERHSAIPPGKSWFEKEPDQGLPIGNLTSQFGSNVYLSALDHLILREFKPAAYLRYMDDLLLLDTDAQKLERSIEPIDSWLQSRRSQALNPAKTSLKRLQDGIDYLGYHLKQDRSDGGFLKTLMPPIKKWEFVREVRAFSQSGIAWPRAVHPLSFPRHSAEPVRNLSKINSRLGHLKHAQTWRPRQSALQKLESDLTLDPLNLGSENLIDAWSPVSVRQDFGAIRLR